MGTTKGRGKGKAKVRGKESRRDVGLPGGRGKAQSASASRRVPVTPPFDFLTPAEIARASDELFHPEMTEFGPNPDFVDRGGSGVFDLSVDDPRPRVRVEDLQVEIRQLQMYVRALADKFNALEWTVNEMGRYVVSGGQRGMSV